MGKPALRHAAHGSPGNGNCERHRPEETVVYRTVERYGPAFLERADERPERGGLARPAPRHYDVATVMARTQIALDPEHHRRARERAASLGISLAEYVRTLVARDIAGKGPIVDPSAVFDLGDSGGGDVARHKSAWVAQAVVARKGRRPTRPKAR
jgi:hypothetical protein